MEDLDQSALVSSSSDSPPLPQPQFKYQFVGAVLCGARLCPRARGRPRPRWCARVQPRASVLESEWENDKDETLFALPAASEPLMHSSADENMDLKEQPANIVPAGHEDFPSVLLESAASLPSLSPLSAAACKGQESLGKVSAVSPTKGTHQDSSDEASKEFLEKAHNPFLNRDFPEFSELEYSQMGPSFRDSPGAGSAVAGTPPREGAFLERTDDDEHSVVGNDTLHNQQVLPVATPEPANEDRVLSADKTQGSGDTGVATAGFPQAPMREEYADFKPFEQVWEVRDMDTGARTAASLEGKMGSRGFAADSLERTSPGRDSASSLENMSFPSTPDAAAYIACAPPGRAAAQGCPLLEGNTVENKTDEKKIEEKKAQIVTAKSTHMQMSNPFLAAAPGAEADYVTTEHRSQAAGVAMATMPEGLTPDLVQEACESELNDAAGAKVSQEAKVDLVRASEALQDSLPPGTQLYPSFEGSAAAPSPGLPDIVMEAPLSSLAPGAGPASVQPGSSPLEAPHSGTHENSEPESENPPPYEEAVNVSQQKVAGIQEERREPASTQAAGPQAEAPYISIACDLIKGTKLPSEPAPTFPTYSEMANIAQPGPDPSDYVEDSSPDSEPVDLFSDDSIPEVPEKQDEAVMLGQENLSDLSPASLAEGESEGRFSASPPEGGKPYLESVQPIVDPAKDPAPSAQGSALAQREKIPLQMEALNMTASSTGGLFTAKETDVRESETSSDSSPIEIIDDFPTFASSTPDFPPQLPREYPDLERSYRSEMADVQKAAAALPGTELPGDLSSENMQPQAESQSRPWGEPYKDASRVSKVPSLPPDGPAVAARPEVGSVLRAEVLEGEAAKTRPPGSGTKASPPSALLSAELSKTSVVDLLYWRDIKKTGVVFGASLFLLLSLTVFSIVSVTAYIALALLSVTICFRIYKGVIQAVQKSDEGHPFSCYGDRVSALADVVSLQFAVLMWVLTYVGALFNGLTLLILALISLFSVPVIYERHQAQIDHCLALASKTVKDAVAKIQAKIPGLKRKAD
ncbi:reticulon-4 [Echinops telfairi]|uniref:Reticulon-4 n=1 Tax=Echinops telfairi TaxID=9371 RepID=A0AC55DE58_ECHTE|nr:reticulon-4 [Echinops telfairi]